MNTYVVGFLRSRGSDRILLIEKNRPDWQAGKLNGIGGSIKAGESPITAMRREFEEETGLRIQNWEQSAIMQGPDWTVFVFYAYGPVRQATSITDEEVLVVSVNHLPNHVLPNLHWLIPLCFDKQVSKPVRIRYPNEAEKATYQRMQWNDLH